MLPKPRTYNGDLRKLPRCLAHLGKERVWLLWRWWWDGKRWTKVPYRADDPDRHASTSDPTTWGDYQTALQQVLAGRADGFGFAVKGRNIGANDLDHCRDPESETIEPWAKEYCEQFPGAYTEVTVSGTGLRILGTSEIELSRKFKLPGKDNGAAIELFSNSTHYLTLSCNELGSCRTLPPIGERMQEMAARLSKRGEQDTQANNDAAQKERHEEARQAETVPWNFATELHLRSALGAIPTDEKLLTEKLGHSHDAWIKIGMAIERLDWGERGYTIFRDWSSQSAKEFNEKGLRTQWSSFNRNRDTRENPVTVGTIFHYARKFGWSEQQQQATATDQSAPLFNPWAQYLVPSFPIAILPPVARDFVASQSVVIGCDPSALAMAVLATLSGALDHRFALKMLRHGTWWEHPRFWVLLVGDPSTKKTPGMNAATWPLEDHQKYVRDRNEAEWDQYLLTGGDANAEKPKPPRFVAFDATIEKLGDILSRNPRGVLLKRDEVAGWIGAMEKYTSGRGAAADRGFWLQCFDGGPFTVDRITRGELHIPNLSVSILGGIQPARLAEIHGLTSDGLLQRFIPVMMGPSKFALDQAGDDGAYSQLVRDLIFAKHARLIMSDNALVAMDALRRYLHELASGGLASGFQTFVGKLPGIAGRLTLLLHMAADPNEGALFPVEESTVANVRQLIVEFIVPHAFEFYGKAEDGSERLRKLASWLLTCGKNRFVASDITSNVREFRGLDLFDVNKRLSPLVAGGWIEPQDRTPANRAWAINPAVLRQFEKQTQVEAARKEEIVRLIRSQSNEGEPKRS
jgi:Protein of unknown function (DUF3987)/Primase C terminal 2 (PriCT-2)